MPHPSPSNFRPLLPSDLPGPDTTAKEEARTYEDARLQELLKEAARIGWPQAFHEDLYVYDVQTLAAHHAEPLVWILRQHGTHLFPVRYQTEDKARHARDVLRYWGAQHAQAQATAQQPPAHFYVLNGSNLSCVHWQDALRSIRVEGDCR